MIICLGLATFTQYAKWGPTRLVFSSEATAPVLVIPSQIARYSGRLGISRQITSPFTAPWLRAQRAYLFDCSARVRKLQDDALKISAAASPKVSARSSMTAGSTRVGSLAIGAVDSNARNHR